MTKRQQRTRFRQVRTELLTKIQARFPLVEYIDDYERPPGTFIIRLHTPDDNGIEILDMVSERIVDLCVDEDLDILVLPLSQNPIPEAA